MVFGSWIGIEPRVFGYPKQKQLRCQVDLKLRRE